MRVSIRLMTNLGFGLALGSWPAIGDCAQFAEAVRRACVFWAVVNVPPPPAERVRG